MSFSSLGGADDASRLRALGVLALLVIGCSSELPSSERESEGARRAFATERSPVSETTDDRVWGLEQKLVASDRANDDNLGTAVAVSGDTAIVGTMTSNENRGAAYVFVRSGVRWSEQQKLTVSDVLPVGQTGVSVAI